MALKPASQLRWQRAACAEARWAGGEMPPEEEKQPTADEIGGVVDELTQRIREGSAQRLAKRGSVVTTAVAGVSGTTRRRRIRFATGRRKNR